MRLLSLIIEYEGAIYMLYYVPYHEHKVHSATFCITRPVIGVFNSFH